MAITRSGKRKRKTPFQRFLKVFFILILFVGLAGLGYAAYTAYTIKDVAKKSYKQLDRGKKSELREQQVTLKDDPVTILLMGVDDYEKNDKGRTDTLMLFALNPKTKEVSMLSIPRDTRTFLKKVQRKDKINAAYAYDNEQGTVEAVQSLLDVPVDYYIKTGVQGFQKVIDELGGITVNVPFDFKQPDLKNNYVRFYKGKMTLNGSESLAFVRMRYDDPEGDFGREKRQQEVIKALADKAVSLNTLTKANSVIRTLGSHVTTNLELNELLGLRTFYNEIKNKDFNRLELKGEGATINRIWYFVPDQQSIKDNGDELRRVLEIKQDTTQTDGSDQGNDSENSSNQ